METTSPRFFIIVLFFAVSGVRATVENSEDDFEENNHRVDAEQEPFTKVTLAAKSGDAISTLFRSCLEGSRTFDAKFASIETPGGITYIRYVPDSSMLTTPIKWVNAVGSVSDIFGCTSLAEAGGYSMFKYSANGCQLATEGYDLEKVPDCEDNVTDAVFIKLAVAGSCAFPSIVVSSEGVCLLFTDKLMTYDAAESFCSSYEMVLYMNSFEILTTADVIDKITDLGYKSNMWIGAYLSEGAWQGNFPLLYWVGGAQPTDGSVVAYLDSQAGWKLKGAQASAQAGAVCMLAA